MSDLLPISFRCTFHHSHFIFLWFISDNFFFSKFLINNFIFSFVYLKQNVIGKDWSSIQKSGKYIFNVTQFPFVGASQRAQW